MAFFVLRLEPNFHPSSLPNSVCLFHPSGVTGDDIEQLVPYIRQQTAINGRATAYICNNYVCKQPITIITDLKLELEKISRK